jgi:hypothetical protein
VGGRNEGRGDGVEVAKAHCPVPRRKTTRMESGHMTHYSGNNEGAR